MSFTFPHANLDVHVEEAFALNNKDIFVKMRELIPLYEGFLTYGGMSVREMEAITVGLDETMDEDFISQGPQFIAMVDELMKKGVPVVTGRRSRLSYQCHGLCSHIPQEQYPAGALAAALYIASGVRRHGTGTLSSRETQTGPKLFQIWSF